MDNNNQNNPQPNGWNNGPQGPQQPIAPQAMNPGMQPQPSPQFAQQPYAASSFSKPKSNTPLIIGIIASVVIIALVAVGGIMYLGSISKNSDSNEDKTDTTSKTTVQYTKVAVGNTTYSVPTTYKYVVESGALVVTNESEDWAATIKVLDRPYEAINDEKMKTIFAKFNPTDIKKAKFGGREYYTSKITLPSGNPAISGFTKADSKNMFVFEIDELNSDLDENTLNSITPILDNTTLTVTANSLTSSNSIIDEINIEL